MLALVLGEPAALNAFLHSHWLDMMVELNHSLALYYILNSHWSTINPLSQLDSPFSHFHEENDIDLLCYKILFEHRTCRVCSGMISWSEMNYSGAGWSGEGGSGVGWSGMG